MVFCADNLLHIYFRISLNIPTQFKYEIFIIYTNFQTVNVSGFLFRKILYKNEEPVQR